MPWTDRYSGKRYRAGSADEREDPEVMQLQTYRDVVREFRTHSEAKSAGADGRACGRQTFGLLWRRVVRETVVAHVGKEANRLEEVEAGARTQSARRLHRVRASRAVRHIRVDAEPG